MKAFLRQVGRAKLRQIWYFCHLFLPFPAALLTQHSAEVKAQEKGAVISITGAKEHTLPCSQLLCQAGGVSLLYIVCFSCC